VIAKAKLYLIAIGIALLAFFGIYGVGFTRGQKDVKAKTDSNRLTAIKTAKEVENEIQNDTHLVERARARWLRQND
jgi:hypothetical protein